MLGLRSLVFLLLIAGKIGAQAGAQELPPLPVDYDSTRCYHPCVAPPTYAYRTATYAVYTGSVFMSKRKQKQLRLRPRTLVLRPGRGRFILREIPGGRGETRRCYVEIVAEKDTFFYEVRDTSRTTDYVYQTFRLGEETGKGGERVWHSAICADELSPALTVAVQRQLAGEGLMGLPFSPQFDQTTALALERYQRRHALATGALTRETLYAMDLEEYWPN